MMDCETLRSQAAKCRRLAESVGDKLSATRLLDLAREYEAKAEPDDKPDTEDRSFSVR